MKSETSHDLRMMLVVGMWGINYLILPQGVSWWGAGTFTLLRFALTLPVLFLILGWRGRVVVAWRDVPQLLVLGWVGITGYQSTFAAAVQATTTANAAVLFSLSPVFSLVLSGLSGRESLRWSHGVGMLVAAVGGLVLVLGGGQTLSAGHWRGDLLMLGAAFLWALAAFMSENLLRQYGGLKVMAWSLPSGVVGLMLVSWGEGPWPVVAEAPSSAWWSLAFAVLGATVIGVVMFYDAIPHLGARKVMAYMYLVPVIAILIAGVVSGAWLNDLQWLGVAISLCGIHWARGGTFKFPWLKRERV